MRIEFSPPRFLTSPAAAPASAGSLELVCTSSPFTLYLLIWVWKARSTSEVCPLKRTDKPSGSTDDTFSPWASSSAFTAATSAWVGAYAFRSSRESHWW